MNMWAVSALPVHQAERGTGSSKRKAAKNKFTSSVVPGLSRQSPPASHHHQHHNTLIHDFQDEDPDNIHELLEPAIDGPPSPERIRALSNQVKSAVVSDKHQSHHSQQTTSSGSSSLRSLASAERPSWEHALEGFALSRRSSGRSTSSSMPSRERPDSVQIFGKTLFNRRRKFKRESSAQSSSGSSLYSTEYGSDATLPPTSSARDSTMPALFNRRRPTQDDAAASHSLRKFMISEPYNFQHVTHTHRDDLPQLQHTSRMALASEFSQIRASRVPSGGLRGIQAEDLHFHGFSSEALPLRDEFGVHAPMEPHTRISRPPSYVPRAQVPQRRMIKHTRSQEPARIPPPRPPRSPIDTSFIASPPIPPPRISSRGSMRHDGFDNLSSVMLDRPQTSNGIRHTPLFSLGPDSHSPLASPERSVPSSPQQDILAEPQPRFSRMMSPSEDANWPLPCAATSFNPDAQLPNVPEEEENTLLARRSRASIQSTRSSLRGSQSVPMLRKLSLRQGADSRRRSSGASDTLGRFDMSAAQRALKAALMESEESDPLARESWEDDIDYCYEHEAEADCDYAWERPSCDMDRDCDDDFNFATQSQGVSPAMLTPGQFEVPALSPASQHSAVMGHEAITPTVQAAPRTSNFSLPRTDASPSKPSLSLGTMSNESRIRESQEFNLSPTLLIPRDFQQAMASADETLSETSEFTYHAYDEEPTLTMDTSVLLVRPRTSASTMASNMSGSVRSVFERHHSTTSASTDFTRLTMSTTSLDMLDSNVPRKDQDGTDPAATHVTFPAFEPEFVAHARVESRSTMPPLPEDETADEEPIILRDFASRGSEPNLVKMAMEERGSRSPTFVRRDSAAAITTRRQRARTTSLSTPPPGQYGLFPRQAPGPRF